jgi:[ribosomal protein S18]-alanine N-acetyltransferase
MALSKEADAKLSILPLENDADARICARIMAGSEPWITLGRSFESSLDILRDPTREVYLARDEQGLAGFVILCLTGALVGYIQTVCIDPRCRGKGLGTSLVQFAEKRILRVSPNVFMCVSSFNVGARRLYQRLGYEVVGELSNFIVQGHAEILLRKTVGPSTGFAGTG